MPDSCKTWCGYVHFTSFFQMGWINLETRLSPPSQISYIWRQPYSFFSIINGPASFLSSFFVDISCSSGQLLTWHSDASLCYQLFSHLTFTFFENWMPLQKHYFLNSEYIPKTTYIEILEVVCFFLKKIVGLFETRFQVKLWGNEKSGHLSLKKHFRNS